MTLAETTRKLDVSFYAYLRDRITGDCAIPPLANLVSQAADEFKMQARRCPRLLRSYQRYKYTVIQSHRDTLMTGR
jgi:hypothetical protein